MISAPYEFSITVPTIHLNSHSNIISVSAARRLISWSATKAIWYWYRAIMRTAAGILEVFEGAIKSIVDTTQKYSRIIVQVITHHLRTAEKFFSLRFLVRSLIETSVNVAKIPVSILPLAEYLWHSLRTLLQSGSVC